VRDPALRGPGFIEGAAVVRQRPPDFAVDDFAPGHSSVGHRMKTFGRLHRKGLPQSNGEGSSGA